MSVAQRKIGFLAEERKVLPFIPSSPSLFRFDSGRGLTVEDIQHNVLALGTTGSGKTTSFVLPLLDRMIEEGFSGLCCDVKGNFTHHVRTLAKRHGREDDVVELSPRAGALPVNLFLCEPAEARSLFNALLFGRGLNSHNEDFMAYNVESGFDVWGLLRCLSKYEKRYMPTLAMTRKLQQNFSVGQSLLVYFGGQHYNRKNYDEYEYLTEALGREFSPVAPGGGGSRAEQMGFRTNDITAVLSMLSTTPGIERNFFTSKTALDMEDLVYRQNKIVCLCFPADTERAGNLLTRHVLNDYYKAVFRRGLRLKRGKKTFLVVDEMQQVLKTGGDAGDDMFVAKSREFNNLFVGATQSISALESRSTTAAVRSMLGNFRSKVIFRCDDPSTTKWAEEYGLDSRHLERGEAAVLLSPASGRAVYSTDGLQTEHDRLCSCFDSSSVRFAPAKPVRLTQPVLDHLSAIASADGRELLKKFDLMKRPDFGRDEADPSFGFSAQQSIQSVSPEDLEPYLPGQVRAIKRYVSRFFSRTNGVDFLKKLRPGWSVSFWQTLNLCSGTGLSFVIADISEENNRIFSKDNKYASAIQLVNVYFDQLKKQECPECNAPMPYECACVCCGWVNREACRENGLEVPAGAVIDASKLEDMPLARRERVAMRMIKKLVVTPAAGEGGNGLPF